MADPEHLKVLKRGVAVWNTWRNNNPDIRPDLSNTNLGKAALSRADLRGANLSGANLYGAHFRNADLSGANLSGANLYGAHLRNADLSGVNLMGGDLRRAGLMGANLSEAALKRANFRGGDLSGANLNGADLRNADLRNTALSEVDFSKADLNGAYLDDADLTIAVNLTQEQIDTIRFGSDHPPRLPDGLELPDMGDAGAIDTELDTNKDDVAPQTNIESRTVASAQRGVCVVYAADVVLNASRDLNIEDAADQILVDDFRAAIDALKKELITKNDQIAALAGVIATMSDENVTLQIENNDLRKTAETAASLGKQCREKFFLRLSEKVADGIAIGAAMGTLYFIGQLGGEIADLFTGDIVGGEPPMVAPTTEF